MDSIYTQSCDINSVHSLNRAKERAGLNRKKAERMIGLARERGIGFEECRWSLDKAFLSNRTTENTVAIAYNGFCFIFDKETDHCITMYLLPKTFGKKKTFYKGSRYYNAQSEIAYA